MDLTLCQTVALQKLNGEGNLFVTGYAGTGKSYLLSHFIRTQTRYETVPVLASTGAAAVLIGGRTFHSFFGLGVMRGAIRDVVESALANRNVKYRIRKAEIVVIDEVSMLSGQALEAAEAVARSARGVDSPWGGLRIIAIGDFAQLPPVSSDSRRPWAFLHPVWSGTNLQPLLLTTGVRTREPEFIGVLNDAREGKVTTRLETFLNGKSAIPEGFDGTRLFPLRESAEKFNLEKLSTLPGKSFSVATTYAGDERGVEALKNNAPIPEVLNLRRGAKVMIRVNDPQMKYVNGTVGEIVSVGKDEAEVRIGRRTVELKKISFSHFDGNGEVRATATNFPLTLAWAATIHKSQGATLEEALLDLHGLWEPGHAYVALSRLQSAEGLFVSRWSKKSIKCDPLVTEFYKRGCPPQFSEDLELDQTEESTLVEEFNGR